MSGDKKKVKAIFQQMGSFDRNMRLNGSFGHSYTKIDRNLLSITDVYIML